jgi:hypothetical protein
MGLILTSSISGARVSPHIRLSESAFSNMTLRAIVAEVLTLSENYYLSDKIMVSQVKNFVFHFVASTQFVEWGHEESSKAR